jgi:hypothetical protein
MTRVSIKDEGRAGTTKDLSGLLFFPIALKRNGWAERRQAFRRAAGISLTCAARREMLIVRRGLTDDGGRPRPHHSRLISFTKPIQRGSAFFNARTRKKRPDGWKRRGGTLGNIQRVDVLPFHQMGRFKWKELGLEYKLDSVLPPTSDVIERVRAQFVAEGLTAY